MNELELINAVNSLYGQRKQLENIQTSSNQEEIDIQIAKINKDINLCMSELEKFSSEISPSSINIEFG